MSQGKPIGILYEHPDWFRPLFAELDHRGIAWRPLDAAAQLWDPGEGASPWSLVFNRSSVSAALRGRPQGIQATLQWLRHLERLRVPVVNGAETYAAELSKAYQLTLLAELGLPFPRSRVINHASQAPAAARDLRFPVLVKANVGGSGAGIERFDTLAQLEAAAKASALDLGLDRTALVQELAPLAGDRITRVEVLDGKVIYAIHVYPEQGSFNLCPGDACQTTDGRSLERAACPVGAAKNGMRVERAEVSAEIAESVLRIARRIRLDVGGVELLVDARDGKHYFYDVNALSNFVADPLRVIGFDPFARLVDVLVARAAAGVRAEAA
jgi:glutathione synthase/RimK-type ligase-like ATP-grasp enzyme